jgi:hypothetical protein
MIYKGYELSIDMNESSGLIIFSIPKLSIKICEVDIPNNKSNIQWFKDEVDLHLGRGIDPSKFNYTQIVKDQSIVSDDINHGLKHKFDREIIAKLAYENPRSHSTLHDWDRSTETAKEVERLRADRIISYVEEVIYG